MTSSSVDIPAAHIRAATADEAGLLSALALRSKAHWGYSPAFMAACRAELTYTPEQIESGYFQCAVTGGTGAVAGFYALERLSPEVAELVALFVEPAAIGKGYGRLLMAHAKRTARRWGAKTLVVQSDPNAARFYQAAGGVLMGQQESASITGRFLPTFTVPLASGA